VAQSVTVGNVTAMLAIEHAGDWIAKASELSAAENRGSLAWAAHELASCAL